MSAHRSLVVCGALLVLVACGRSEQRSDSASGAAPAAGASTAASPSAAPSAAAAPAPALSLSQVEGTWQGKSLNEKDSVVATWTLDAGSDTSKWSAKFANGPKVPVHVVSVSGDSLVAQMPAYKSVSMKGQTITVRFVARVRGDSLAGNFESRLTSKPDSVRHGRLIAARTK
jgi:hypothetical protein